MLAEGIIGNTDVKEYLEKSVKSNGLLHSYLFLGVNGIGKKEIAKDLNMEQMAEYFLEMTPLTSKVEDKKLKDKITISLRIVVGRKK